MDKSAPSNLTSVSIKNFKSVKSVTLSDCRRINVLIGRPNVGKSNILEALALFDVPYMVNSSNKSLRNLLRIEKTADLFHNGVATTPVDVSADSSTINVVRGANNGLSVDISIQGEVSKYAFSSSLTLSTKKDPSVLPDVLAYFFPKHFVPESSNIGFLLPPSGGNLMETVANLPDLKSSLAELFHGYDLKMMFDSTSRTIVAMKENGIYISIVPFNSLGDSLRRLIFYKAAIEGNRNKTICFDDLDALIYQSYISDILDDIISASDNRFFITTHSQYVISSLLDRSVNELAVYVVDMKGNETVVNRIPDGQLQYFRKNGDDLFSMKP
ncbi:AAA family ATPase [Bacteroides acidifaciens]|uniref:AAA family ATPase n=1 Tax=Bacteroides acidifaciens TaxID=85831 RepID=UPI0026287270|nr:AAA family ATPase [Bacteroides acidifaciens]